MATSGRVNSNTLKTSSFYVNWQRKDYNIPSNYSDINWQAGLNITGYDEWYSNAVKINSIAINGTTAYSGGTFSNISGAGDHQLASGSIRIYHNTDGTKTFNITISGWLYGHGNTSGSTDFTLDKIPRYATINNFEVLQRNETSVKVRYTTDVNTDYAWYSKDNGSTWADLPTTAIIEGLNPDTTYPFKIRVRRTDSQLTTDSPTFYQATYDYPKPISLNHFTIGEGAIINLLNPLGRNCTLELISKETGESIGTYKGNYNGEINSSFKTEEAINKQYASIPNSQSGGYYAKVTYGNSVKTLDWGGIYSIKGTEIPIFNDFTYKDINADIVNVTGNDQVLVKGFSNLQVTVSSANKMIPVNSANPNKYIATLDTLNKSKDYEDNDVSFEVGTPVNGGTKRLTVTAYDSRSVSKAVYKDILVYDYVKPVINVDVARLNNFEAQTTLKINGTYDVMNIDNSDKNAITQVQYRYRETGGDWTEWITVNTTVTGNKFTCNDVILSLDITKSFEIEVRVIDKISDNVARGTIDVGEAIFFISSNKKQCYINSKQVMTGLAQDVNRTDLNNYMNEFVAGYGHNLTNAPNSDLNLGHFVSIPRHDVEGFVTQLFIPYTTNDIYIRKCEEGIWSEWTLATGKNIITGQEIATNDYVDGKQVFVERVDLGTLPNTSRKNVNLNLDLSKISIVKISGIAVRTSDYNNFPLPFPSNSGGYAIGINPRIIDGSSILAVETGIDRSNLTGSVDIYYTKKG